MNDILPSDSPLWQYLEGQVKAVLSQYGYREIRMPIVNPSTGNLENVPLPPYATLVDAYQRLQAGTP